MIELQLDIPIGTDSADRIESFRVEGERLVRVVRRRDGTQAQSSVRLVDGVPKGTLSEQFDWCWLRATKPPRASGSEKEVRIADLFSGGGLMTLGAVEALRAVGLRGTPAMLLDVEPSAAKACERNFDGAKVLTKKVEEVIDGAVGAKKTATEKALVETVGTIDLLLGGPPCQGHSDLNNHTRRQDGRNELAMRMARFCELFQPKYVVLENVRGILHDSKSVLSRIEANLRKLDYSVETVVAKAELLGVPQRRHRVFLVATKQADLNLEVTLRSLEVPSRTFAWACSDLLDKPDTGIDGAPVPSLTNKKRIDYLFENNVHDLPDSERPDCHRNGGHSYKSVYGRLWWDRPAQTITTGFRAVGQGRYVHPKRRRALTAHEAARLQSIPDYYNFGDEKSTSVATLIGNAVPPKLAYAVTLAAVR
ncbi:MAG: DNA cytosine methyltransferase [Gemmatimonadaceae bacterium]|nr:DNA cytosine methyltransferase [Gemmatimonadaceae bacterium]